MHPPSFPSRRSLLTAEEGFSLVEICLALGIMAFAVLPVVGLLSIGLNNYRNTVSRDRATQVLNQIGTSMVLAKGVNDSSGKPTGIFTAQPPFQYSAGTGNLNAITWQWGQPEQVLPLMYFDGNGAIIASGSVTAMMVVEVILQAPTNQFGAGSAQIVVAWPASSAPSYTDADGMKFSNAEGHVETTVSLLPTGL